MFAVFDEGITVSVHGGDELGRYRVVRQLRALAGIGVVEADDGIAAVDVLLLSRHDPDAPARLRAMVRANRAPLLVVADDLGPAELMAVGEYGVQSVLWRDRLTPGRLARAVHNAAGCCPRVPLPLALV
ncbi:MULTISPECIES: DNA-binding response regulator [Streptomyces]|uniref:DNA-binding response regulator n=1 Tax=Streptomyces luteosporeus TaxID=173856 RepID=A0ABN3TIZ7_9ACTN